VLDGVPNPRGEDIKVQTPSDKTRNFTLQPNRHSHACWRIQAMS